MNKKLVIFTWFAITGLISGQVISPGACPRVDTVTGFDLEKYVGTWYEIYRTQTPYELDMHCVTATYTAAPENVNHTVNVMNKGVADGELFIVYGQATKDNPNNTEAKFTVSFPTVNDNEPGPYWVIDTDYERFSVVTSCVANETHKTQYVWMLTRETYIDPLILTRAFDAVAKLLEWRLMMGTSHTPEACKENSASAPTIAFWTVVLSMIISKMFTS